MAVVEDSKIEMGISADIAMESNEIGFSVGHGSFGFQSGGGHCRVVAIN